MIRKLSRAGLIELVEEVGVDEPTRSMVGPVRALKASHTLYKAARVRKVAADLRECCCCFVGGAADRSRAGCACGEWRRDAES